MWRSIIIIVFLCGALAWVLTGGTSAPQRSGTLTLNPAPEFPKESQADLGRAVARILPHCPGLARFGGELLFTAITVQGAVTRIAFTVPEGSKIPREWGPYAKPCTYTLEEESVRIGEAACQALCLGKLPDPAQETLSVDLKPAPEPAAGK